MAERTIASVLKTVVASRSPGVRIPLSPPLTPPPKFLWTTTLTVASTGQNDPIVTHAGQNGHQQCAVFGSWQTDTCDDAETAISCETQTFDGEPDNPDGGTDPAPLTCNGLNATIIGTEGDDTLNGTWRDDVIVGLGGNDVINGASGNDTICGGTGNDTITA